MSSDKPKLDVPLLERAQQQVASDNADEKKGKVSERIALLKQQLELLQQQEQEQTVVLSIPPQHQVMASSAAASASSSAAPLSQFFNIVVPTPTSDAKAIIQPITSAADLERLKKLADPEQGNNVEAQAHLGRILLYGGWGVTKDAKEAEKWLRLASKQKASGAQLDAQGICYAWGFGVTQNNDQAHACYQKAVDEYQYAPAQFHLAQYQQYTMHDEKAAFQLYNDAANQFYPPAIVAVGECHETGYGTLPDHTSALQNYQLAAKQEYPYAYAKLGIAYSDGIAGQNYRLSMTYLEKAAKKGDEWGQYWLAYCYMNKSETVPNVYEATEWYKRSAAQGNEKAQEALCCGRPKVCTML